MLSDEECGRDRAIARSRRGGAENSQAKGPYSNDDSEKPHGGTEEVTRRLSGNLSGKKTEAHFFATSVLFCLKKGENLGEENSSL